jgi:diguanylate cyclase (GGDEF)-like protein/PAS domain S-box-containing protein
MAGKTRGQLVAENIVLETRLAELEARLASQGTGESPSPGASAGGHSRVEEALMASEVRYRRLFETAKDGILILDAATGTITDCNPFLEQLLGYAHDELIGRMLWEIGPFRDIAASQLSFQQLQDKEYIRYEDLPLETKNGEHKQVEFISNLYEADATRVIQCNIRDITARKLAEASVREANEKLTTLVRTLRRRDSQMTLLSRMSDLLQTCETQEEAHRVIALNAPELFVGQSGCLAMFHETGRVLEVVARWGDGTHVENSFPMEACWALRRGRLHEVTDPATSLLCSHFVRQPEGGYRCLPLTVQGETVGVLHLSIAPGTVADPEGGEQQLTLTVGEAIKLSLANLRLRKKLQEQATRDPLTGLFNRRYLEDTLPRELHRALRRGTPLCVAMIDLDHFKQFNDTFGHDAGDLALRESSRMLRENLRKSDVACRYGGEEFLLVLPDSSLEDTSQRLEQIRLRFEAMEIRYKGLLATTMTFSAGIAAAPEHGSTSEELLKAADDALYDAKFAGRNRVLIHRPGVDRR